MKAKVVRGGGFRGALDYVLDEGEKAKGNKRPEILAGTMLGTNARELSAEFSAVRAMRPDIKKPVWHCSLSCPPGEHLDSDKWAAIAEDYMQHMHFPEGTQWIAIRHNDAKYEGKPRDHIHIIASRISVDGQIWLGKFEAMRAIDVCQALEEKHDLIRTKGLTKEEREVKPPRPGVRRMAERLGQPLDALPQKRLQRLVYTAMQGNPSVVKFAERLQSEGVAVCPTIAKTGRISGFSFVITDENGKQHAFKGSQLGKAFAWAGLQKAGVTYDLDRDRAALEELATRNRKPKGESNEHSRVTENNREGSRADSRARDRARKRPDARTSQAEAGGASGQLREGICAGSSANQGAEARQRAGIGRAFFTTGRRDAETFPALDANVQGNGRDVEEVNGDFSERAKGVKPTTHAHVARVVEIVRGIASNVDDSNVGSSATAARYGLDELDNANHGDGDGKKAREDGALARVSAIVQSVCPSPPTPQPPEPAPQKKEKKPARTWTPSKTSAMEDKESKASHERLLRIWEQQTQEKQQRQQVTPAETPAETQARQHKDSMPRFRP